jgi:multidrug resistance protein
VATDCKPACDELDAEMPETQAERSDTVKVPDEYESPSTSIAAPGSSVNVVDEEKIATQISCHSPDHSGNSQSWIVSWDSPDDVAKPTNWPARTRWTLLLLTITTTFVAGFSSSVFAPGVPLLLSEFDSNSRTLGILVVSIFVLGLATGPLFFAPLSELYGRLPIHHIGNVGFLIWTVACAVAPSLPSLIGFRLVQGVFAAIPFSNGAAIIADTVKQEERGFALAMFTLGLLAGPVVGPVCGGFLNGAKGWRWTFWLTALLLAIPTVASIIVWKETYEPVLLDRKAARLRKETGNVSLRSQYDRGENSQMHFRRGITRAAKMLIFCPTVLVLAVYMGLCYSYFYLLLTTISTTFQDVYGFSDSVVGLAYLGLGSGYLLGPLNFAWFSDRILKRLAKKHGGEMKPEYRLPLAIIGAFAVPISFFWYGWTAQAHTHWILPIIGPAFLGFGNSFIFMSIQAYLVDAFTIYAASALAANTIVRSVMAAMIPLAAPSMYQRLGLGWGNSLLAFLAVACIPIPFGLMRYGEKLRKMNEGVLTRL